MGIKGHRERALIRRGLYVQEALQRRNTLNENALIRRNLVETEEDLIKLNQLCGDELSMGIEDSVYCALSELLDSLSGDLAEETYQAILNIYNFFRPIKKDNRVLFKKTIQAVFKNENPTNSLILISKFLNDPDYSEDAVKKALIDYRNRESISQDKLEDFLKQARFKEYSKYEESFSSDNFDLRRGVSKLSHGQINQETGRVETFYNLIKGVYDGRIDINLLIDSVYKAVLKTEMSDLLYKSDLEVKNNLMVGDEVIIPKGGLIEVKKFDYEIDSYFSEYFAIYKNSNIPKLAHKPKFKNIYNTVIDGVFRKVSRSKRGKAMIEEITNSLDAIMFDRNLIILKDNLDFYWSNKGQRGCDELRLSIRFRVKNPQVTGYIYNSSTHSNQLEEIELEISPKSRTICQ